MSDMIEFIPEEEMCAEFLMSALSETYDWGLQATGVQEAHKHTKGAGVKVAVLDTGYAPHDDLAANVVHLGDGSNDLDGAGHGTHVSGVIAAAANGIGIVGVAPEAQVLPIKVLNDSGKGGFDLIEAGIRKAMAHGVDIINMSLGASATPPDSLHQTIKEAAAKGIIIFAAAGNDHGAVNYPARFDEVIAVAAMDQNGKMARFSSRGDQISAGAPGVNIYSTYLNNGYAVLSGTSQACPFMTGIGALLLSYARANPDQLVIRNYIDMLKAVDALCDPTGRIGTHGKDGEFGYGLPQWANFSWKDQ